MAKIVQKVHQLLKWSKILFNYHNSTAFPDYWIHLEPEYIISSISYTYKRAKYSNDQ